MILAEFYMVYVDICLRETSSYMLPPLEAWDILQLFVKLLFYFNSYIQVLNLKFVKLFFLSMRKAHDFLYLEVEEV